MYDWASSIIEKEWNYTINRTDDQSKKGKEEGNKKKGERYKGKEIFILNYFLPIYIQLQLSFWFFYALP